jgi:hypothetical protein
MALKFNDKLLLKPIDFSNASAVGGGSLWSDFPPPINETSF